MSQLCAHQLFMECLCPLLAKMWVRSYAGKMQYWQRPSWHVQFNQCQLLQDVQYVQYWGTAALWQLSLAAARHCWSQSWAEILDQQRSHQEKWGSVGPGSAVSQQGRWRTEVIYRSSDQDYDPGDKKPQRIRGMQNYKASVWFLCSGLLQNQGGATWRTPWKKISSL